MTALRFVVVLLALAYAVVNAFGAWAVVRRKPWVAGLFMLAAAVLTVAAVAVGYALWGARYGLLLGVVLASLASFFNARIVIGRVVPRFHALRALLGLLLVVLAWLALPLG